MPDKTLSFSQDQEFELLQVNGGLQGHQNLQYIQALRMKQLHDFALLDYKFHLVELVRLFWSNS